MFADVFCEPGVFTVEETRTILTAARAAGLALKLHADELTAGGGAELAAELGATSARSSGGDFGGRCGGARKRGDGGDAAARARCCFSASRRMRPLGR